MSTSRTQMQKITKASPEVQGLLSKDAITQISSELRRLLADVFALYLKTKNFHWHMSGAHFRDYHLLLDEQAGQIFAMTDVIAERARKLGGTTLHSVSDITQHQRLRDNNDTNVSARDMLVELSADNQQLTGYLRAVHELCARNNDVATTSLVEIWIDETERRTWFLSETVGYSRQFIPTNGCRRNEYFKCLQSPPQMELRSTTKTGAPGSPSFSAMVGP